MRVIRSIQEVRRACKAWRHGASSHRIGLVPTMGALHEGHLSLVRAARTSCDRVVATIFVNPLQFGPNEDFFRYPRTFERDCDMLNAEGVALLFAPAAPEMYPPGLQTWVDAPELSSRLDGAFRPGHFRGVATVVTKLFHIVQPDEAFFGQKDAAQVAVLGAIVRDLNFDLKLVVCPTVRDPDGLALSSRNRYLSASERDQALAIPRALGNVEHLAANGQRSVALLRATLLQDLQCSGGLRVEYAEIVDAESLQAVETLGSGALVSVAAWVGNTRLIDNLVLPPEGPRSAV